MSGYRDYIQRAFGPVDRDYVPGWCGECDQEVVISTSHRPYGKAKSCEEHWPLCEFSGGGRE